MKNLQLDIFCHVGAKQISVENTEYLTQDIQEVKREDSPVSLPVGCFSPLNTSSHFSGRTPCFCGSGAEKDSETCLFASNRFSSNSETSGVMERQ